MRKRIEGKGLAEFFGEKRSGQENGGVPGGLPEAARLAHKDCNTGIPDLSLTSTGIF